MNNTKICAAGEQIATRDFQSRTLTAVPGDGMASLILSCIVHPFYCWTIGSFVAARGRSSSANKDAFASNASCCISVSAG
ncbi:hypothetical protein LINPERHAP2_LOCUS21387 [Linum perenne]